MPPNMTNPASMPNLKQRSGQPAAGGVRVDANGQGRPVNDWLVKEARPRMAEVLSEGMVPQPDMAGPAGSGLNGGSDAGSGAGVAGGVAEGYNASQYSEGVANRWNDELGQRGNGGVSPVESAAGTQQQVPH